MSKPNANSKIERLSKPQRAELEMWLFDENMAYARATKQVRERFNLEISQTAVADFYHRRSRERMIEKIIASRLQAGEVVDAARSADVDMSEAMLTVLGQVAFDGALEKKLDSKTLVQFTKVLMSEKKRHLAVSQFELSREKFHFDATKKALAKLPELRAINSDDSLDEDARIQAARKVLFGDYAQ